MIANALQKKKNIFLILLIQKIFKKKDIFTKKSFWKRNIFETFLFEAEAEKKENGAEEKS